MIYTSLVAEGWPVTIKKFAPRYTERRPDRLTVGEYLKEAESISTVGERTKADYQRAFRRLVADIHKIGDDELVKLRKGRGKKKRTVRELRSTKFDYRGGGRAAWLAKVDAVALEDVTSSDVEEWMASYVKEKSGENPAAERSAKNSANSIVRQASALFSKAIVDRLGEKLELPNKLPFDGVRRFPRQSTRYRSQFDAESLLRKAQIELQGSHPEAFKILLLGLTAGLRRKEIDCLLWHQIDFKKSQISVEATEFFRPKSEDSVGTVDIDPEVASLLEKFHEESGGQFVIHSDRDPRPNASYSYVRAKSAFDYLYEWLRKKGISNLKPAHALRKEFGSLVCERHGLYEASRALRHASVETTAQHYLDKRGKRTVGLGEILKVSS